MIQFNLLFEVFHKEFKHFIVFQTTDFTQLIVTPLVTKEQILFGLKVYVETIRNLCLSEDLAFEI